MYLRCAFVQTCKMFYIKGLNVRKYNLSNDGSNYYAHQKVYFYTWFTQPVVDPYKFKFKFIAKLLYSENDAELNSIYI